MPCAWGTTYPRCMADVGLETVGIGRQGQGGRAGPGQGSWAGYSLIPSNTLPCTELRSMKLNSLE